ncbi:oxygen-insensitive NADPH nitroreductase [Priestia flexa]|uniref:oxygen-insensitive NADPH nitroreductase n=1 Tax=Priestia flexa TaxID=86664 RepID=UPI00240D8B24|nr:oxygen-insensitive NADPH nitroreductase [Priestia flexa]WEZ06790.1 oxygen-insensitive NADPH nitroreductase [Priestia flexa]
MNEVIETILSHRSVRKYRDKPLTNEQIHKIVESAQAASTSSYIQAYSIIGVKNQQTKNRLAELAGNQPYVAQNGHLLIFCADLHRHDVIAQIEGKDLSESLESAEKFMVALIDAALAAQNASVAAESMGLGICYIGGLRNQLQDVQELLKLPGRVLPLFGLTIGYPAADTDKKPRLPQANVYHEEVYEQDQNKFIEELKAYDEQISSYYNERTNGKRNDTWTGQMAHMLSNPTRMYMKEYVEKQGFNKK